MKRHETQPVMNEFVAETTCDICGATTPGSVWPADVDGGYKHVTVKVEMEQWSAAGMEITGADLCPACFREVIIARLRHGPQVDEIDRD